MVSSVSLLFLVCAVSLAAAVPQSPGTGNTKGSCKLPKHPSVNYLCIRETGVRPCAEEEPNGSVVRAATCNPNYYSTGPLPTMRCIDGAWDVVAICLPECGRGDPKTSFAAVYKKNTTPYTQICGGALISPKVVISVAHCVTTHDGGVANAADYAVAFGKTQRPWDSPADKNVQKSDVAEIAVPPRYRGSKTNFQEDLSVLLLKELIMFTDHVRPVCLDFDNNFETRQLRGGNNGQIVSWGGVGLDKELSVIDIEYVPIDECLTETPNSFTKYITADKFCAGRCNSLYVGDSGHGLLFPETDLGVVRHYLRGVSSVGMRTGVTDCPRGATLFTQISKFEHLIKEKLF